MILTDKQLKETITAGHISITPYDERQIQAASYDIRVGDQGATTSAKKLVNIRNDGYLVLQPGDFGIVMGLEEIHLGPQYVGRIGLRSKYARKGISATTGPQIDPGFHGRLIVGLTNLTPKPVTLPHKDDLLTIEFHKLEEPSTRPYDGPYQGKLELGPEEIEMIVETQGMALSEMLTTLGSLSQNVANLANHVRTLEWTVPLIVTFGIALIGILVMFK